MPSNCANWGPAATLIAREDWRRAFTYNVQAVSAWFASGDSLWFEFWSSSFRRWRLLQAPGRARPEVFYWGGPLTSAVRVAAEEPMVHHRVRLRFCKQGDLRLISHRDLVRTMERLFRRAGIALAMSEGFHPKPRMMFPSALALGTAGLDEPCDVDLRDLTGEFDPAAFLALLNAQAPPGLSFHAAELLPPGAKKARAERASYEIAAPEERREQVALRAAELAAAPEMHVSRQGSANPIEVRPLLEALCVEGSTVRMTLRTTHEANLRPRDVLAALGLEDQAWNLARTRVELQP